MAIETGAKHEIFGVSIDDLSLEVLKNRLSEWLDEDKPRLIFTPNPEFLLIARQDSEFKEVLSQSDLSLADGTGLKFAIAALTDGHLSHRQTGVDTLVLLAQLCAEKRRPLLLLGGASHVADLTAETLKKRFPLLNVSSINPGFVSNTLTDEQVEQIRIQTPQVLAVALGAVKQEQIILQLAKKIPTLKIAIGVGGALDTIAGRRPRAPFWVQRLGFEWVWRVLIEPRRINRILRAAIVFPILVILDTLKHRRFLRACRRVFSELYRHFTEI